MSMSKENMNNLLNNQKVVPLAQQIKLLDSEEGEEVKEETEEIETKKWICPYCDEEIKKLELFYDEDKEKWYHSPCKDEGAIHLPNQLLDENKEIKVKPINDTGEGMNEEKVIRVKNQLTPFLQKEEKRWFMLVDSFGVGPLQDTVAGVTQFEVHPTKRNVNVILDIELVQRAPDLIVGGVLAHELKHVNQVKTGRINRLEDRAEVEKEAFQHERSFFLRHREDFDGNMKKVIDERIAQIDQLIQAYENDEIMFMAKDVQIGFKK